MEFKINIGETFVDAKRDLTILDREVRKDKSGKRWKWYKYKCNKCGFDNGWNTEHHILNGVGCSCCYGRTVVKGINDVATTHPEYIKYFANIEDAYKITYCSTKNVLMKCPNCGTIREIRMEQFHNTGLSCKKCSDGVSYPEKFVFALLEQIGLNFIPQLSKRHFDWCEDNRYDFYLPEYNCIVETHGNQHYVPNEHFGSRIYVNEEENDEIKYNLAIKNGISNYFVIDSRRSNLNWMKKSIIESGLLDFLSYDVIDVDWARCQEYTATSLVKAVCDFKNANPNLSTTDIAKILNMWRTTVQKYLQRGSELGICVYDKNLEIKRGILRASISRKENQNKSA